MTTDRYTRPAPAAAGPPKVMGPLFAQFGRPSGWLGGIAGFIMAKSIDDDRWLVKLLDVQADDRVLEVGFGPGVATELIAARATEGLAAGVDPSDVMLKQAARRNWRAVQAHRVQLQTGTVSALPFPDESFTKALALHSIYFWPSVERGLRELHRVLEIDGRLAIGVRMHQPNASRFSPARYGLSDDQVAEISSSLLSVGFRDIETEQRILSRQTITAILARRS